MIMSAIGDNYSVYQTQLLTMRYEREGSNIMLVLSSLTCKMADTDEYFGIPTAYAHYLTRITFRQPLVRYSHG
jgi:hypothetical protein